MSYNLLTLSFHRPGWNLREDAFFKKYSKGSSLISGEALGDSIPGALAALPGKDASGLVSKAYEGGGATQISMFELGLAAWNRPDFRRPASGAQSEFEKWIRPKVESECSLLLLCGHHAMTVDRRPAIWGRQAPNTTALLPMKSEDNKPVLLVVGSAGRGSEQVLERTVFDFSKTLKNCRAILIIGCASAGKKESTTEIPGHYWQEWAALASAKKPIILGWYGTIGAPKDQYTTETFSKPFWEGLVSLSAATGKSLQELCEQNYGDVIQLWGRVLKQVYSPSKKQRFLWYGPKQGAGAVDPTGGVWRALKRDGIMEKVA